jgi:hypothetical protein
VPMASELGYASLTKPVDQVYLVSVSYTQQEETLID